jgi:hypothetical protein
MNKRQRKKDNIRFQKVLVRMFQDDDDKYKKKIEREARR